MKSWFFVTAIGLSFSSHLWASNVCKIVMVNNVLPDAHFELYIGDTADWEEFNLVGENDEETSILKSYEADMVVHAATHDGGVEDGVPRIVDEPVTYIEINGVSCKNPKVIWPES